MAIRRHGGKTCQLVENPVFTYIAGGGDRVETLPLRSYVRNWTRTDTCQVVRVFLTVRVILNGMNHIDHLQFSSEAFASASTRKQVRLSESTMRRLQSATASFVRHIWRTAL